MKITHVDGSVTDTDKMNDLSSQLLEKTKEFTDFMCSNKIPFLLRFCDPVLKAYGGAANANDDVDDFARVLDALNSYVVEYGFTVVRTEDVKS